MFSLGSERLTARVQQGWQLRPRCCLPARTCQIHTSAYRWPELCQQNPALKRSQRFTTSMRHRKGKGFAPWFDDLGPILNDVCRQLRTRCCCKLGTGEAACCPCRSWGAPSVRSGCRGGGGGGCSYRCNLLCLDHITLSTSSSASANDDGARIEVGKTIMDGTVPVAGIAWEPYFVPILMHECNGTAVVLWRPMLPMQATLTTNERL